MGCWDEHRPRAVACMCFCTGLVGLIIVSVIFAGRVGEEVKLWYHIPLCPTPEGHYVSRDVGGADAVCPTVLAGDPPLEPAQVRHTVPMDLFVPGLTYSTFVYRTTGVDIWTLPSYMDIGMAGIDMSTRDGSTAETTLVPQRRVLAAPGEGRATVAAEAPAGNEAATTEYAGNTRKLLKGSSSSSYGGSYSGPSYRSRGGDFNYFGSSSMISRGRHSRSSSSAAVPALTVVQVASRTRVRSGRLAVGTGYQESTTSCTPPQGCEFVVNTGLYKDEFLTGRFTVPDEIESGSSYSLAATAQANYSSTLEWPNIFVVFASNEDSPDSILGYAGIPLFCVMLCLGPMCALRCKWEWCPGGRPAGYARAPMDDGTAGGGGGGAAHGGTTLAAAPSTASTASTALGTFSMVQYPFPTPGGGVTAGAPNGDATSTALPSSNPAAVTGIAAPSNDITRIAGLARFPVLQAMNVSDNDLRSLDGLAGQANALQGLLVDSNNLVSLAGLQQLPELTWFKAASNDIRSLTGGGNCPNLKYLCVANNDLESAAGIEAFPSLTHVDLSNNALKSVSALTHLTQLLGLDLSQNDLTSAVELTNIINACPGLAFLDIRGNDFTAVDKQAIRDLVAAAKPHCQLLS